MSTYGINFIYITKNAYRNKGYTGKEGNYFYQANSTGSYVLAKVSWIELTETIIH